MRAQASTTRRPAIAVKTGIVDQLQVRTHAEKFHWLIQIIRFNNSLAGIVQTAIAKRESAATCRRLIAMIQRKLIGHDTGAEVILRPAPMCAE
jgi:hypothetical protein